MERSALTRRQNLFVEIVRAARQAGIQRIRKAHWKHGIRSAKLQAEHRQWKRQQEAKETAELMHWLMKDRDPLMVSLFGVPQVRVRYRGRGRCKGGPPKEWEDGQPSKDLWKGTNSLLRK